MKKFKKLIPAFCMLMVSAVLLGTSTYAWFSMNTIVNATGMNVKATSDTKYFVISTVENDIKNSTTAQTTAQFSGVSSSVAPVAYTATAITAKDNTTVAAEKWYTATSNDYNKEFSNNQSETDKIPYHIANSNVTYGSTDHFVAYTFFVGLAGNSNSVNDHQLNIKVARDDNSTSKNYIKATVNVEAMGDSNITAKSQSISWDTLSGSTGFTTTEKYSFAPKGENSTAKYVKVIVYLYIDGSENGVNSSVSELTGGINVTVSAVAPSDN